MGTSQDGTEHARVIPARGGWLAVSTAEAPFTIATVGSTESEALERFSEAMAAWHRLRQSREAPPGRIAS